MSDPAADAALDQFSVTLPDWPYPGLRPFEKHEWPIFFGRERMSDEVVTRLVREQFLVVHGDSGCGKSSLIRAGVLPRLEQENARGGLTWRTCVTQPRNAPLELLAGALAALDGRGGEEARVTEIRRVLNFGADAPPALAAMLRRGETDHICVLVDQFEELFAFARQQGSADARLFVQILVALLEQPPQGLYAVVTMRSEFLGACAHFPGLAEAVNRAQYLLPRMGHGDLTRAIREPASLYGGQIAPDLAERLILDSGSSQDQLPLIQHGLMLLYRKRSKLAAGATEWRIGLDDYQGIGDLTDSLSDHADEVLHGVETEPFPLAEKLFRSLTEINADGQAVRRPRTVAQLAAVSGTEVTAVVRLVDAFRAEGASFLTPFGAGPIGTATLVDISHEALIRCWGRIASSKTGWLVREFQDGLIWRSLLVQAESFERNPLHLLSLSTAEEQERWLASHNPVWADRYGGGWDRVQRLVQSSLLAGRATMQQEQARARRWQRSLAAFGAFLAVVAVALFWLNTRANSALARANEASAASLWNRLDFASADRIQDDELNALWEVRLADNAVRSAFFEQLSHLRDRLVRLGRRPLPVMRALYLQWAPDKTDSLRDAVLRETGPTATPEVLLALAPAVQAAAGSMTSAQAHDLFTRYLVWTVSNAAPATVPTGGAMQALVSRFDPEQADSLLNATLDGFAEPPARDDFVALGAASSAIANRLSATQVDASLSTVLGRVATGNDAALLGALTPTLQVLSRRLDANQVGRRLSTALDALDKSSSQVERAALTTVAMALSERTAGAEASAALGRVVNKAQSSSSNDDEIATLVALTAILAGRAGPEDARQSAAPVAREIATSKDARRAVRLALILQPLFPHLPPEDQHVVVRQVARSLATSSNIAEIGTLATLLGIHGGALSGDESRQVVPALIGATRYANETAPLEAFASATRTAAAQLTPAESQMQILAVFRQIQASVAPGELAALAAMLPGLAAGLSQADAARLLPDLWQWMTATTDVAQLRALSFAVPALAGRLTEDNGRRSLPGCMRYLMGTSDPDQIGALAVAARTLADLIPVDQRAAALTPLQAVFDKEPDPDRLARLSSVIPPLVPALTAAQANVLFRQITRSMENTLYPDQLLSLRAAAEAVATKVSAEDAAMTMFAVVRPLSVATDTDRIEALTAAAQALGTRVDPALGDVLLTLIGWAATPDQAAAATRALIARSSASPAEARVKFLVEVLKYPTKTADAAAQILGAIGAANKDAPGPNAGLDANLAWVAKTYPDIRLDDPPACPRPVMTTQTCPSTERRSLVEQLAASGR